MGYSLLEVLKHEDSNPPGMSCVFMWNCIMDNADRDNELVLLVLSENATSATIVPLGNITTG